MQNVNRVVLTGNLTRDPELKNTTGGTSVCQMRIAVNGRVKNRQTDQWEDSPNYFDVVCFGAQADNVVKFLAKGRPVAIDGRLDWREWDSEQGKRQAVQIIAETVQFLSDGSQSSGGGGGNTQGQTSAPAAAPAAASPADDEDIPFLREEGRFEWDPFRGHANR